MDAETTIREYYAALRAGEPLPPFFAEEASIVKFGITERLSGYGEVADGLREQTRRTTDWTVTSRRLSTIERDRHACFTDGVRMAWTDTETGARRDHETRWSGTLERREGDWQFVGLHVSVAEDDLDSADDDSTATETDATDATGTDEATETDEPRTDGR